MRAVVVLRVPARFFAVAFFAAPRPAGVRLAVDLRAVARFVAGLRVVERLAVAFFAVDFLAAAFFAAVFFVAAFFVADVFVAADLRAPVPRFAALRRVVFFAAAFLVAARRGCLALGPDRAPPSCLLTVAQARRSASFLPTPRAS
ncbi:hypothetical protein [Tahibacter caeni]|uniref:hypothetical protein n=1 Tax=Tahibacter caeni TaxID=1453545 RepID=UPI002147BD10|nr:hypothetical protein [Tahibacter caeni]